LTLSNEIYLDSDEVLWEGRSIPPADKPTVFDPKQLETGRLATIRGTVEGIEASMK